MKLRIPLEYLFIFVIFAIALPLPAIFQYFYGRAILFGFLLTAFAALAMVRPKAAVIGIFFYLCVLGDFRRYSGSLLGYSGTDPLLLVGPVATALMLLGLVLNKQLRADTRLSKCVMALMGWMVVEIFNPLQGGLSVGVAGAMFVLTPLSWFWIGKQFGSGRMIEFVAMRFVIPIAMAGAALGIYQILFGLLPYEDAWVKATGYKALYASATTIKALSFFTNAIEYVRMLCLAMGFIVAAWFMGRRTVVVLFPFLFVAMFLESNRTSVVVMLFVVAALWAAQGRSRAAWMPRLVFALAVGAAGVLYGLTQLQDASLSPQAMDLVEHQTSGLLNPLDRKQSSATTHAHMIQYGIKNGFTNPIGLGLGSTTLAASKFGSGGGSTEVDISDMFLALGVIGGMLYLFIVYQVLQQSIWLWQKTRRFYALLILSALLVTLGNWLLAGDYAKNAIVCFMIGTLDALCKALREVHVTAEQATAKSAAKLIGVPTR